MPKELELPKSLRVSEIFQSVQGEGGRVGLMATFVRLAGCNLQCAGWPCDTPYAQSVKDSKVMDLGTLLSEIPDWPPYIVWTGGEPLMQMNMQGKTMIPVMNSSRGPLASPYHGFDNKLLKPGLAQTTTDTLAMAMNYFAFERKFAQDLFTNGSFELPAEILALPGMQVIMDFKLPSSGEYGKSLLQNIPRLRLADTLKFVVATHKDYMLVVDCIRKYRPRAIVTITPAAKGNEDELRYLVDVPGLVKQIILDKLQVRFQLQMHKYIWPPKTRGV